MIYIVDAKTSVVFVSSIIGYLNVSYVYVIIISILEFNNTSLLTVYTA